MSVSQSNPNCFGEMEMHLQQLQGFVAKVGWFETAKYTDGTPVGYVAAIQEMGSGPIPPRPFMRPAAIKNQNKWIGVAKMAAERVLSGKMSGKQAMTAIALQAESDILDAIIDVNAPPLSPITLGLRKLRQEGRHITGKTVGEVAARLADGTLDTSGVSTKPLNDTGYMIASLTHMVTEEK